MTRAGAERAVTISALVVFGVYFYRLLSEGHSNTNGGLLQLGGIGAPPNLGRFITGWGTAFLLLAIITEASPPLGGSLAILVATGDVLANGTQVAADVNHKLGAPTGKGGTYLPPNVGPTGIPAQQANESNQAYDKRLGQWLLSHPHASARRPAAAPASGAGIFGAPALGGLPGQGAR